MSIKTFVQNLLAPAAPAPVQSRPAHMPLIVIPKTEAVGAQTDFEKKFAAPPYFTKARISPTLGLVPAAGVPVSERLVQHVFDRAGGEQMLSKADREKLGDLHRQWLAVDSKMGEWNFMAVGRLWREEKSASAPSILAGRLPTARGYNELRDSIGTARAALHEAKVTVSSEVFRIVEPACRRMQNAAMTLAQEQDKLEIAAHREFFDAGTPFVPSATLRGLIFIALKIAMNPCRTFFLTKNLAPPEIKDLFSLWWTSAPVSTAPQLTPPEQRAKLAASNRRDLEAEAREREKEELDIMVLKIKEQAAANIEAAKDREAIKDAEKERRRRRALSSLNNPTPPAPGETK